MTAKFAVIEGGQAAPDKAGDIVEAIKELLYEIGQGQALALVLGCLEIAKAEILAEALE